MKTLKIKKEFAGNYKVYSNGVYLGYVMVSDDGKRWTGYNTNGQPFDTADTKKEILTGFEI